MSTWSKVGAFILVLLLIPPPRLKHYPRGSDVKFKGISEGGRLTGIRLIIYHLDGALVDTSDAICLSINAALEDAGETPCSDE
jgi:hypothetical protein